MDKIKQLMVKCGLSEGAANQICESVQTYVDAEKQKNDKILKERIAAAKKVCVQETEAHKNDLARRCQVFLEATVQRVEHQVSKQAEIREGEATVKLEEVHRLLDGIAEGTGVKEQLDGMRKKMSKISEERNAAVRKANKQNGITEKILKRNRELERQLHLTESGNPQRQPRQQQPNRKPVVAESNRQQQGVNSRLDQHRRSGQATTTRRTLAENNDLRQLNTPPSKPTTSATGLSPAQIAAGMEDGPPT